MCETMPVWNKPSAFVFHTNCSRKLEHLLTLQGLMPQLNTKLRVRNHNGRHPGSLYQHTKPIVNSSTPGGTPSLQAILPILDTVYEVLKKLIGR